MAGYSFSVKDYMKVTQWIRIFGTYWSCFRKRV